MVDKSSNLESGWREIFNSPKFHLLLITLIGLVVYSNTFHVPFLFDDEASIVSNGVIKDLGGFLSDGGYAFNPRRFVGYLTFALNYRLGGLEVAGYHIFNLAVHLLSAFLVYAWARLTFRTPYFKEQVEGSKEVNHPSSFILHPSLFIPLFAALLFVVHPVQTQAVTYIVQRLTSLATLFYLLSLVLYIRARLLGEEESAGWKVWTLYALSLASAVLAMKTKEIAFTLPAIVLLYELFFFKGAAGKRLLFLLPMLLTFVIVPLSMVTGGKPAAELLSDLSDRTRADTLLSRSDYLFTQFRVMVTYLRLLFFPANQNLDYDYPIYTSFFTPPVFVSFLMLAALFTLAIYLYRRSRLTNPKSPAPEFRLVGFGILWFFIALSVESSIVPIADVIFEHRLYLPAAGVFVSLATLAGFACRRFHWQTIAVAILVILVLAVAGWKRNQVWGDAVTLWTDAAAKSPAKARPNNNLGGALNQMGEYSAALEPLRRAIRLDPGYAEAYNNLGSVYDNLGYPEQAVEQLQKAISIDPSFEAPYYNLGVVYAKLGWQDRAIEQYTAALKANPDYADAHNNLGTEYGAKGMIDQAIEHLRIAVSLKPEDAAAHLNLAMAYEIKGWRDLAEEQRRMARGFSAP